jgi:hypothetical protein
MTTFFGTKYFNLMLSNHLSIFCGRKIRLNLNNVVSFFWSDDGVRWTKANSYEVSGYNHNVGDGFLSLRPALFESGVGDVLFRKLSYRAIRS